MSGETAYVINRMLHKDPGQRYGVLRGTCSTISSTPSTRSRPTPPSRAPPNSAWSSKSESQSNVAGILTLLLLVLMIAGAASRRFFSATASGPAAGNATRGRRQPKAVPGGERPDAEAAYEDARHDVVAGRYGDAKESFDRPAPAHRPRAAPVGKLGQSLHQGLTALLNNELTESRAIFGALAEAGGLFTRGQPPS